jgi:tetratricopeptide (TPR) repeat protein
VALFDRIRRLLPARAPSAPFEQGTRALERSRLGDAEDAFRMALAAANDPAQVARIRNKLAIVALRRDGRAAAVDQLVLALEADPRSVAAITTIGNLLLEDGSVDDAIAHYEYALLIDDAYAPAHHNLGVALHRSGRKGEAVRSLRKATRLETRIKRP